jgi:hypothetical protein
VLRVDSSRGEPGGRTRGLSPVSSGFILPVSFSRRYNVASEAAMTRQDLGEPGRKCFESELSRYPGVRENLRSRLKASSAFTYYPTEIIIKQPGQWNEFLYDSIERPMTETEREHLHACLDLVTSFVRASDQHYLLVHTDYFRLDRLDSEGRVPVAPGEILMILKSLEGAGWDRYNAEVWTYLRGKEVDANKVELTMNRGMLNPRPLGILSFLECPPKGQSVDKRVAEDIVRNARYIVYDAFDGQWPIFAELLDGAL